MGFRDISFIRKIPERRSVKVKLPQLKELLLGSSRRPASKRVFMRTDRYYLEGFTGQWIPVFASGLTLSQSHIARMELKNDHAIFFVFFPESMACSAKRYGGERETVIYDMGIPIGKEKLILTKLKQNYHNIQGLIDDYSEQPTIYDYEGYRPEY